MPPSRGVQNKRSRRSEPAIAASPSDEDNDEEEEEEVNELESLREEMRDLKISISCIRTGLQDQLGRLAGLERHVMDSLIEVKSQFALLATTRTQVSNEPLSASNPVAMKLLDLLQESRTGLKKVVREAIKLHMFSPSGGMYAPDDRKFLAGSFCI